MGQRRRASLIEALANTAIGFCVSLLATLTILPALGVEASVGQSVSMTLAFTGISIVRGYLVRRLFDLPSRVERVPPTHYHVDRGGVSVYRGGVPVARIDMNKGQMVGLAVSILQASRETTPTAITNYLRD